MHAVPDAVEDVGVDHGGAHIGMSKKLLDDSDIVTNFMQMGGEGVAKRMADSMPVDIYFSYGCFDRYCSTVSSR